MSTTGLIVRWVARFLSATIALIIFIIFVGEVAGIGHLNVPGLSFTETVMNLLKFVAWLGFIVGWRNEKIGASMIILGTAAFYAAEFIASGSFPGGLFFLYWLIPGIFYLVSDWMNREAGTPEEPLVPVQDD